MRNSNPSSANSATTASSSVDSRTHQNQNSSNDDDDDDDDDEDNDNNYENDEFEGESESDTEMASLQTLERLNEKFYQNKTFSAPKIREIERENAILMDKILKNGNRRNQYTNFNRPLPKRSTSNSINKQRNQMKIDWENQMLLRKIQAVKPAVKSNRI